MAEITAFDSIFQGVTIYGNVLRGVSVDLSQPVNTDRKNVDAKGNQSQGVVSVRAFKFAGRCQHLPSPIWIPVFGEAKKIKDGECGFSVGEVQKWTIDQTESITLVPQYGNLLDALGQATTLGVSGGVDLENARREGNKICVDVVAWGKVSIFGHSADFDKRVRVCVGLNGVCVKKELTSWADLEVCYNGVQVCAELTIDKWGYEESWEKCVGVGVLSTVTPEVC